MQLLGEINSPKAACCKTVRTFNGFQPYSVVRGFVVNHIFPTHIFLYVLSLLSYIITQFKCRQKFSSSCITWMLPAYRCCNCTTCEDIFVYCLFWRGRGDTNILHSRWGTTNQIFALLSGASTVLWTCLRITW